MIKRSFVEELQLQILYQVIRRVASKFSHFMMCLYSNIECDLVIKAVITPGF